MVARPSRAYVLCEFPGFRMTCFGRIWLAFLTILVWYNSRLFSVRTDRSDVVASTFPVVTSSELKFKTRNWNFLLLLVLMLVRAVNIAAWRWGVDSTDGPCSSEWERRRWCDDCLCSPRKKWSRLQTVKLLWYWIDEHRQPLLLSSNVTYPQARYCLLHFEQIFRSLLFLFRPLW